ncbi:dihydroorotase [Denitratisoma sp. DHT3]|uniref:dihydroorotase n=1 Tax=Denitratisoma sp. DHT3 TaxID=1981880 RepID=UPI0011984C78|nr:dihydroorotase [Denitratisoma sp. DHT3]QDX81816.1 dihydroorotase [Denitratisoma sp. DHT3]
MKLQIKNGRLVDPAANIDRQADLFIAHGRVAGVGTMPAGFADNGTVSTIDAAGCVVCPGLVDLSARLREPGYEYRATLESEMAAAAAGGVTSLACPPDTDPPLDEPGLVEMLKHRARLPEFAKVYPIGALTEKLGGKHLTEMAELAEAGCVAFGQANSAIIDTQVLLRAMQYAATFDFPVWLAAQDPYLARGGIAHDGEVAARLGLAGIPVAAETIALATILQLARVTGARVHITRISSAMAVDMIAGARAAGVAVTCDVAVHHLHLCENDIGFFDPHARLDPPLRAQRDRDALRRGLASGVINALCSDHTPVDDDGKQLPFGEAEPGATGLELLLPLTLKWGREMGLSLSETLAPITAAPARLLGVEGGSLAAGAPADICIFNPAASQRVSRESLRSQGKNTPFLGWELEGRVRYTLVDGHLSYDGSWG